MSPKVPSEKCWMLSKSLKVPGHVSKDYGRLWCPHVPGEPLQTTALNGVYHPSFPSRVLFAYTWFYSPKEAFLNPWNDTPAERWETYIQCCLSWLDLSRVKKWLSFLQNADGLVRGLKQCKQPFNMNAKERNPGVSFPASISRLQPGDMIKRCRSITFQFFCQLHSL